MDNRDRDRDRKREFRGYYVDVTRAGGDAIKAYRRIKKQTKRDRFFEIMKEKQVYRKPSEIKREAQKRRIQTLHKLQKQRDNEFAPYYVANRRRKS